MPNLLSVTAIKQRRQELMDEIDVVLDVAKEEKRELDDDEQKNADEWLAEVDDIDNVKLPRAEKYQSALEKKQQANAQAEPQLTDMGLSDGDPKKPRIDAMPRHRRLIAFKGEINGKSADERAYEFGHWVLATMSKCCPTADIRNAGKSVQVCRERGLDIFNVAQTDDNANAGVFVPEQFGQDLVINRENYGKLRQTAEVLPMFSDTRVDPKWTSGLTAFFTDEGDAITESDTAWENIKLVAKDLGVLTRMSKQLYADAAIDYGDRLVQEIAYAMALKEDTVAFTGAGLGTDGGVIGINSRLQDVDGSGTDSNGLNTQNTGVIWSDMVILDFHETIALCPGYALERLPIWICSSSFYHGVMAPLAIAQAGGATILEASQTVGGATVGGQFLGFPVVFSQVFPIITAETTVSCIFGAMQLGFRMGDRQQESVMFSEHASVGGQSVFERNQIAVRSNERIDIVVHGYGTSSVSGPIVGLQTGTT